MHYGTKNQIIGPAGDAVRTADIGTHTWVKQRVGKRIRIICSTCRKFYGYLPDEAKNQKKQVKKAA